MVGCTETSSHADYLGILRNHLSGHIGANDAVISGRIGWAEEYLGEISGEMTEAKRSHNFAGFLTADLDS